MQSAKATLCITLITLLLGACGLKGPLYLPDEPAKPAGPSATTGQQEDADDKEDKDDQVTGRMQYS